MHPERRTSDESEWTYEDKGIYIADAVAGGDWLEVDRLLGRQNYTVCNIEKWTKPLREYSPRVYGTGV